MKELQGLAMLLICYTLGLLITYATGIIIPGAVIGMFLLFIFLYKDVIKEESVENVVNFFVTHMTICFIPAGVKLLRVLDLVVPIIIPLIITIFLSTVIVIVVTGWSIQFVIKLRRK